MRYTVKAGLRSAVAGAAAAAGLLGSAGVAYAAPDTWGQEVKACNQSSCYPGGTARGAYVRDQARDDSGRGYAQEIHDLANPGRALPFPFWS